MSPSTDVESPARSRMALKFGLIWLIAFVLLVPALFVGTQGHANSWSMYRELSQSGRRAQGEVTAFHPESHQSVDYEFPVDGAIHQGHETRHGLSVRSKVTVTYLARDPRISCLDDPAQNLRNEVMSLVVGSAMLATAITGSVWRYGLRSRSS